MCVRAGNCVCGMRVCVCKCVFERENPKECVY